MYGCTSGARERVLDVLRAQLGGLLLAGLDHDAQLFLGAVGVAGRQPRHADADARVEQVRLQLERGAELALGGAGAALLEQSPGGGEELLGIGRGRGRNRRGLVVAQVAFLVLLARPARTGIVAPCRAQAARARPRAASRLLSFAVAGSVLCAGRVCFGFRGGFVSRGLGLGHCLVLAGAGTIP